MSLSVFCLVSAIVHEMNAIPKGGKTKEVNGPDQLVLFSLFRLCRKKIKFQG